MKTPASTWTFEDGKLTVHHLGREVSLGRYANRDFAANAAAAYFEKHGGRVKHSGPNAGHPRNRRPAAGAEGRGGDP